MLLRNALTAFRGTNPAYTVEKSLLNNDRYIIKDGDGNRVTSGVGHTRQQCEAMKNDAILQTKIVAAMKEMISVKSLTMAMMMSGAPDAGARALAVKMLPNLIALIGSEDGEIIENGEVH